MSADGLAVHLEALYAEVDATARLRADPVAVPHRYTAPEDVEIAGLLAASLAYGRVTLFLPVLDRLCEIVDARGGPRAFVVDFDPLRDGPALQSVCYRFNTPIDFVLLFASLQRLYRDVDSLESLLGPVDGDIGAGLTRLVDALRSAAVEVAPSCGVAAADFGELPRGFRYFAPSPASGSACKRWNMYLRWMVRSDREGIDLGIWRTVPTAALVVPLDTHVLRVSQFLGLTARKDGSWRTALEVTRALRELDPDDPIRFDFSLAHLGISGACRGRRDAEVCPGCPLDPVCQAPP